MQIDNISILRKVTFFLAFLCLPIIGDDLIFRENGVGARARAMGNAYVALSNDYSAVYFNPAGLGFAPVREMQVGISGKQLQTSTRFGSINDEISKKGMRVSHAGLLRAIPASRGGLSYAIGFSSPITFDNAYSYFGEDLLRESATKNRLGYYPDDSGELPILGVNEAFYYDEVTDAAQGQLNFINFAAGWQVGPGISFGFALSPMFGKSSENLRIETYLPKHDYMPFWNTMSKYSRSFFGIDARMGFLFRPSERISIGARLEFPQYLRMKLEFSLIDSAEYSYYLSSSERLLFDSSYTISIKRPFNGAAGLGMLLPFGTLSLEGNFRAPFFEAPENSPQSYFRVGASAGLEIPVPFLPVSLRCGYSWRQFDWYPYLLGDGAEQEEGQPEIQSDRGEHTLTAGLGIMFRDVASLEFAYSYYRTDVTKLYNDWRNDIIHEHRNQRAIVQFSYRY